MVVFSATQERPSSDSPRATSYKAPIHTQLDIPKKLNPEPQGPHKLSVRVPEGWIEFDPNGNIIEQGAADESGNNEIECTSVLH